MFISTKHPHLGSFASDSHEATLLSPPAPPMKAPAYAWLAISAGAPVGELLTGKYTILNVHTGLCFSDTLYGHDKGPFIPHIALWPIPPIETITTTIGSSTKYFMPSFAIQEKATMGALNIGQSAPIAVSFPVGFMLVQQCQDIGGVGLVAPTGIVLCIPATRLVGFTWGDFFAGAIGMIGDLLAAAIGSLIGKFLTSSRFFTRISSQVAPIIMRRLRIGEALARELSSNTIQGLFTLALGTYFTILQNIASSENVPDWMRYAIIAASPAHPVSIGLLFGQLGSAVGSPPQTGGRRPNIWE
ncbi:MAG TPA: hypothetical protein PLL64_05065 [Rhodothermales bacterium]|nr:hypothetical protein [Bacteroidota bacterium]HRK73623.1 hypothetical protein [Rhodothermales bacterium]HRR07140.1 hypothetical protein [Rhodothermales bacterium]